MSQTITIFTSSVFREQFNSLSQKDKKRIQYDLTHLNITNLSSFPYLKGEFKHFRRYRSGNYRIIMAYCPECYNKYRDLLNCVICPEIEDDIEIRIVIFYVYPRKKLYRSSRISITDFEFTDDPF